MAQKALETDMDFCRKMMQEGGENLKECFQCGTCSVACPMAPDAHPFPRKEMVWASFGQKEKLKGDVDLWLCHNCGNCSDLCPRGAKPAELMAVARDMIYQDLVPFGKISQWMSKPSGLIWLFAIPAVLWFIVWWIRAAIVGSWFPRAANGKIVFGMIFYGDYTIDPIFIITFFGAAAILAIGSIRLWKLFKPEGKILVLGKKQNWFCALCDVLWNEIVTAKKFAECLEGPDTGQPHHDRRVSHTMLVWSFIILTIVTTLVAVGHWGGKVIPSILVTTPMPMNYWIKILANIGAVILLVALVMLTWRRWNQNPKYQSSNYYDWYLLGIIWAVAITGVLTQTFRLMDWIHAAFIIYYIHLVVVWMLFAYTPWSKLGHFVYRTVAMVFARMYGRS